MVFLSLKIQSEIFLDALFLATRQPMMGGDTRARIGICEVLYRRNSRLADNLG